MQNADDLRRRADDFIERKEIKEKNLEGLSGWLTLIGIGVTLTPIIFLPQFADLYSEIFSAETWPLLTNPESTSYVPLYKPYITLIIVGNTTFFLAWIYLAYLFYTKKYTFPKWFIGIYSINFVFTFLVAIIAQVIFPNANIFDTDINMDIFRSLGQCLIWIPYMLVSKRVKATFKKPLEPKPRYSVY